MGLPGATGPTGPTGTFSGVYSIRTVTATTTLLSTDEVVLCNGTAATVLTLPVAASNTGKMITIKRIGGSTCQVTPISTTDFTAGSVSLTAPANNTPTRNMVTVISNGTTWYVLNSH